MKTRDPVDNYFDVIGPRARSVRLLIKNDRRTAAQHLGGMTVECLIKSGVVFAKGLKYWRCKLYPNNPENPKHDLSIALGLLPQNIQSLLSKDTAFQAALNLIQSPPSSGKSYPSLRYHSGEPSDQDFQRWQGAYRQVVNRLHDVFKRYLRSPQGGWKR